MKNGDLDSTKYINFLPQPIHSLDTQQALIANTRKPVDELVELRTSLSDSLGV